MTTYVLDALRGLTESLLRGFGLLLALLLLVLSARSLDAQEARISDLTVRDGDTPVRLVGYGLVVGLDGTGDRVRGGVNAGHTVRSVANLLRRFDVNVPDEVLRTRNAAAVLVTAEASPYLRPGGRFDLHVASVGDATSLRGGVLWITPLQAGPNTAPLATAQGALMVAENGFDGSFAVHTTATIPQGGLLEAPLPTPDFSTATTLYLREPNLETAIRIAQTINDDVGAGTASVDDPGSVSLTLPDDPNVPQIQQMAAIGALEVTRARSARVIIDSQGGSVIAGGNIRIGEAVVSHGQMTLSIGGAPAADGGIAGDVRLDPGVTVQDVAGALYGVAAPPSAIAAIFESLREVGALTAEVRVR